MKSNHRTLFQYGEPQIDKSFIVTSNPAEISEVYEAQKRQLQKEEKQNAKNANFCAKLFGCGVILVVVLFAISRVLGYK